MKTLKLLKFIPVLVLLLSGLSSCFLGRNVEVHKTIAVVDEIQVSDNTTIDTTKYIDPAQFEAQRQEFVSAVKSQFQYDNMTVVEPGENPDLVLVLTKLEFEESASTETVNDADSEYNGMTYKLHKCTVNGSGVLYDGARTKVLDNISASADKEEKVKNNRTIGDLITGDNKDNNDYRQKLLSDGVFAEVAAKCGHRVEGYVSSKVARMVKKGEL